MCLSFFVMYKENWETQRETQLYFVLPLSDNNHMDNENEWRVILCPRPLFWRMSLCWQESWKKRQDFERVMPTDIWQSSWQSCCCQDICLVCSSSSFFLQGMTLTHHLYSTVSLSVCYPSECNQIWSDEDRQERKMSDEMNKMMMTVISVSPDIMREVLHDKNVKEVTAVLDDITSLMSIIHGMKGWLTMCGSLFKQVLVVCPSFLEEPPVLFVSQAKTNYQD